MVDINQQDANAAVITMKLNCFLFIVAAHCVCPPVIWATALDDEKQAWVAYQACLACSEDFTAERIGEAVSAGRVYYGMPEAALRISLGKPLKIVHVENINGKWERWVYPNHAERYVADGVVIRSPYVFGGSFPLNIH